MRLALETNGKPTVSTEDAMLIAKEFVGKHTQPSGLMYVPRRSGEGPLAVVGQEIVVNYEGRFLNGEIFDSSYDSGSPFTFKVGVGQVIKGWDEAFLSMRRGDKRTIIVPYWLAYGLNGKGPKIPPRATLIFEVELLDIH